MFFHLEKLMPHVKLKWKTWSLLQLENSSTLVTISSTSYLRCMYLYYVCLPLVMAAQAFYSFFQALELFRKI